MSARTPRPASILLVVDDEGRVLAGQRHPGLPFLGGVWSFPGGGVSARRDGPVTDGGFEKAALREFREETGLAPETMGMSTQDIREVVRWVTPDWSPLRFDTKFFHVCLNGSVGRDGFSPDNPDDPELLHLGFYGPRELLDRWSRLEILLAPPAYLVLSTMANQDPRDADALAEALSRYGDDTQNHFEPLRGIRMVALRTPTLPPATHTNTYMLGEERLLVVDPATYDHDERERLVRILDRVNRPVEAVVLTHHHEDHVGSAQWLAARYQVPIWAHAETEARVDFFIDRRLEGGEILDIGRDASGAPFRFELLHTPGHAAGHLCLRDLRPGSRAVVCGDMVASIGTIIVDPEEGDMAVYMNQLKRLMDLGDTVLLPSHGAPILRGRDKLRQYLDHRDARERRVLGALELKRRSTALGLLETAYADTPVELWPLAERSCLAHLIKLEREGRVRRQDEAFSVIEA
ncbi:MAG: MBL fold metallo-hydrolase [Myxococcota bacterium]